MEKKILFIADEIPQSVNAGSIQFLRIFEKYPEDKIIVFGVAPKPGAEVLKCKYYQMTFPFQERLRFSRFSNFLSNAQSLGLFLKALPQSLQKIADEFKPDVVISLMQHLTYYYPAYKYARSRSIPLVLFCHDDAEEFSRTHLVFRKSLLKRNATIYSSAAQRICISPQMADKWERKYGVKGEYFYPVASQKLLPRALQTNCNLVCKDRLTIGYAGSLAYGYLEGIAETLGCLESTNSILKIYRDIDTRLPYSSSISFEGFSTTSEETWNRIKNECDVVILPYSNGEQFKELYSTHFPSKVPEYISLGMPIVINGPDYANGVRWGKKYPGTIHTTNTTNLASTLMALKDNAEQRLESVKGLRSIVDFKPVEDLYSIIFGQKHG